MAQRISVHQTVHTLRLRSCGAALRLVDSGLGAGDQLPGPHAVRTALDDLFRGWAAATNSTVSRTHVPIARLAGVQLASILAAAAADPVPPKNVA